MKTKYLMLIPILLSLSSSAQALTYAEAFTQLQTINANGREFTRSDIQNPQWYCEHIFYDGTDPNGLGKEAIGSNSTNGKFEIAQNGVMKYFEKIVWESPYREFWFEFMNFTLNAGGKSWMFSSSAGEGHLRVTPGNNLVAEIAIQVAHGTPAVSPFSPALRALGKNKVVGFFYCHR